MGLDEEEPTLKDVMLTLGNINSRLTAHDTRVDEMAIPEVLVTTDERQQGPSHDATERGCPKVAMLEPHDAFNGMEEVVRCKVADHLRGAMLSYLMTMDDDLADEEQNMAQHPKCQKAVSGKLHTADNTAINHITWPHKLI